MYGDTSRSDVPTLDLGHIAKGWSDIVLDLIALNLCVIGNEVAIECAITPDAVRFPTSIIHDGAN